MDYCKYYAIALGTFGAAVGYARHYFLETKKNTDCNHNKRCNLDNCEVCKNNSIFNNILGFYAGSVQMMVTSAITFIIKPPIAVYYILYLIGLNKDKMMLPAFYTDNNQ